MLNGIEIQVPVKNIDSMRNMEMSFVWKLANRADDLTSTDIEELQTIMQIRTALENDAELVGYTGLAVYGKNVVLTKDALKCDCGKGLLCPLVVESN
jgi:hypothetical protein